MSSKPEFRVGSEIVPSAAPDAAIPCVIMRGGTSRGLFFHEYDLPSDQRQKDKVIMGAVGAPDPRQVDGLGGGDMLLSKVAIVARCPTSNADVECEFANMTPGKDRPTYGTNCGNLIPAVALFAVEEGLVRGDGQTSIVRVRNRNTDSISEVRFTVLDSEQRRCFRLAGMPDTGACVDLDFIEPVGASQNLLLPTGNAKDTISLNDGRPVDVSVVDAGALYVFVKAANLGLTASETSEQLASASGVFDDLEFLRSATAEMLGLVDAAADATSLSPDVPKLAIVGPPVGYQCSDSEVNVPAGECDLVSRIISSQKYHKAYAVTGAIATAAAATIDGSTVHEVAGRNGRGDLHEIRIGHPSGVVACAVKTRTLSGKHDIEFARVKRTARRVSEGVVFVPRLS